LATIRSVFSSLFFFLFSPALLDLHSFPTRRSSDLISVACARVVSSCVWAWATSDFGAAPPWKRFVVSRSAASNAFTVSSNRFQRSEEHTSELQSRVDLVCRLLLEKKKITNQTSKDV